MAQRSKANKEISDKHKKVAKINMTLNLTQGPKKKQKKTLILENKHSDKSVDRWTDGSTDRQTR